MKDKSTVYISKTTAVGIKKDTNNRLDEYIAELNPRPVKSDIISLAVDRYLDEMTGIVREKIRREAGV